jgi:hypothetical protein
VGTTVREVVAIAPSSLSCGDENQLQQGDGKWRRTVSDPLMTSVGLIRDAIGNQVRELGGDDADVDSIAMSAAYAVWVWTVNELART